MAHPRLKRHWSIVAHGPDVVELRQGVWSPVVLTLTDESGAGQLFRILRRLDGTLATAEIAAAEGIPQPEVEAICARLGSLNLLEDRARHALDHYLDRIAHNLRAQETGQRPAPVTVEVAGDPEVADPIAAILRSSSLQAEYRVADADRSWRARLAGARSEDALEFEQAAAAFAPLRERLVVFAQATVNPVELRAFNRISLHHRIPWVHAAVDGAFLLVGPTFLPFRSACYECLEARVVMNLRDSAAYLRYKSALVEGRATGGLAPLDSVLGAMLASMTSFEALNVLVTGTTFTVGKLLTVHLPTLEFAFHEVLRLPDCPACAPAPERDDTDLYFDVRALLDEPSPRPGPG